MLVKEEYQSLLALLGRVETKGIQEAQALVALAQKLEGRIQSWYSGHVTGFKQETSVLVDDVEKAANLAETVVTGKVQ